VTHWRVWLSLALVILIGHALSYAGWTIDDAYISFRYARNLLDGHGLVFNPGERVEGYSNLIWTLLVAAGMGFGQDPAMVAKILGLLSGLACLVVTLRAGQLLWPRQDAWMVVAPLLLAVSPPFALWTVMGLETSFYTLLLTAAAYRELAEMRGRGAWPISSFLLALAAMTRPEGGLFFVVCAVHRVALAPGSLLSTLSDRLVRRTPRTEADGSIGQAVRAVVGWVAPFVVLMGAFLAWRVIYYGSLLPNTYAAKTVGAFGFAAGGILYLYEFARNNGGFALYLLAFIIVLARRLSHETMLLLSMVVAQVGFILFVGADWMPQFRFVVPILPIMALVMQGAVLALLDDGPAASPRGVAVTAGLLFIGLALSNGVVGFLMHEQTHANKYDGLSAVRTFPLVPEGRVVGEWLRGRAAPDAVIVLDVMGAIPYFSGLTAIDYDGLTDATVARLVHARRSFAPEDYQRLVDYLFSRRPSYFVLPEYELVSAAREGSGTVARLIYADPRFARYTEAPVGVPSHRLRVFACRPDVVCP